jgi:hypothetical protein
VPNSSSSGGERPQQHGGLEERPRLGSVVAGQVDLILALPGLSGDEPAWTTRRRQHADHLEQATGRGRRGAGQRLQRQHQQAVPRQHGRCLAEGPVDGRPATPHRRVIETGQVVVNQRGTMEQFDRGRGGTAHLGVRVPVRVGHGQAKPGADAVAGWKHGVEQGLSQVRRPTPGSRGQDRPQTLLDPFAAGRVPVPFARPHPGRLTGQGLMTHDNLPT